MLLAINIGNGAVELGVFGEAEQPAAVCKLGSDALKTDDEYAMLIDGALSFKGVARSAIDGVVIGSVVPMLTERIERAASELFGVVPLTVRPGVKTGFKIRLNDPTELGADIAANAAGAIALCGAPVIVCHIGEVTSVTAVNGDKTFLGGALLPGMGMSLDALSNAALLPAATIIPPRSPLGKNTAECMNAGIFYGQAAAVKALVSAYGAEISDSGSASVVLSGEYAERLAPYLDLPFAVIPQLTLMGLREIVKNNKPSRRG